MNCLQVYLGFVYPFELIPNIRRVKGVNMFNANKGSMSLGLSWLFVKVEINHDDYHICVLSKTFEKEWGFSGNEHIRMLALSFLKDGEYSDFSIRSVSLVLFYSDGIGAYKLVRKDFIEWCVVKFGGIAASPGF